MIFWFSVRIFSTLGPLITTYLFAFTVKALETNRDATFVLTILFALMLTQLAEIFTRIISKAHISIITEEIGIELTQHLLESHGEAYAAKKEFVQATLTVTKSVQDFISFLKETGITGFINFLVVPAILFFVDLRVFIIEIVLILLYMFFTRVFAKKYEAACENVDQAKENYYAKLFGFTPVVQESANYIKASSKLFHVLFFSWMHLQNIIVMFQFISLSIISLDILRGLKGISDLVLVAGYTKESQIFLNNSTSIYERIMEVKASLKRYEDITGELKNQITPSKPV